MPYRYRCTQCRTTSPPVATRRDAEAERDAHRDHFHGGHIPDGERIDGPPPAPPPKPWEIAAFAAFLVVVAIIGWIRWAF